MIHEYSGTSRSESAAPSRDELGARDLRRAERAFGQGRRQRALPRLRQRRQPLDERRGPGQPMHDAAVLDEPVLAAIDDVHAAIERERLEHEQRVRERDAGERHRRFAPGEIELVVPQRHEIVGDRRERNTGAARRAPRSRRIRRSARRTRSARAPATARPRRARSRTACRRATRRQRRAGLQDVSTVRHIPPHFFAALGSSAASRSSSSFFSSDRLPTSCFKCRFSISSCFERGRRRTTPCFAFLPRVHDRLVALRAALGRARRSTCGAAPGPAVASSSFSVRIANTRSTCRLDRLREPAGNAERELDVVRVHDVVLARPLTTASRSLRP